VRVPSLIASGFAVLALGGAPAMAAGGAGVGTTTVKHASAATSPIASTSSGGAGVAPGPVLRSSPEHPVVPGSVAKIIQGVAYAPAMAPIQVQRAIWAGNKIRHKPYSYGGGHGSFNDTGYDCSGSVSYVLHAAGLLHTPFDSGEFMSWGNSGLGHWITVYTNPSHAFIEIAGIRFDTSSQGDPHPTNESGPRYRPLLRDTGGFMTRHPAGF
jgi:cell wall-associated NlpC family hydrolase